MIEIYAASLAEFIKSNPFGAGIAFLFLTGLFRDQMLRRSHDRGIKVVSEASIALIEPLQKQYTFLDIRVTRCEEALLKATNSNEQLFAGIGILLTQIHTMGAKPLWIPRDSDRIIVTRGAHIEYQ